MAGDDNDKDRRSAASELVDIARSTYELGISTEGLAFGHYADSHIVLPLRGGSPGLRGELARRYFEKHERAANGQALTDAQAVLDGDAAQPAPRRLHMRVGESGNRVYIDMADTGQHVVVIGDGAWHVAESAPILFRRSAATAAMPHPERVGIDGLDAIPS